jgi:DNA primase
MFPIFDVSGKVIGFGGRVLGDGMPKYLNSPQTLVFDKSKNLFALNFARKGAPNEFILVEGYLDTISMHQAGFTNAIASLGTAFNANHSSVIRKYSNSVTILFDSDEAGVKATLKAINILTGAGIKAKALTLSGAKDPDEFIKRFGSEKLAGFIRSADNYITYQVNLLKGKYNLQNTEEKIEFTYEVSKILSSLGDKVLIDAYTEEISKITNISVSSIKSHIESISHTKITDIGVNTQKKIYRPKNTNLEKGLLEANKGLIYIISSDHNIYLKVKAILKPDELSTEVYRKLLGIIYGLHEKGASIYPADIVSKFESQGDQSVVSEAFSTAIALDDYKLIEKALNDQIRLIKRHNIDLELEGLSALNGDDSFNQTQNLSIKKRNLNKLYITLIDG